MNSLCVDLDGTLIAHHSLWHTKGFYNLKPWLQGIKTLSWSQFKWAMGQYPYNFTLGGEIFHTGVLEKIQHYKNQGALCFLVTGSSFPLAIQMDKLLQIYKNNFLVDIHREKNQDFFSWINKLHGRKNAHLIPHWKDCFQSYKDKQRGFFHGVFGSSPLINLVGKTKAQCLKEILGDFDYIGNSFQDFPVWKEAKNSYVVGPKALELKKQGKTINNITINIIN